MLKTRSLFAWAALACVALVSVAYDRVLAPIAAYAVSAGSWMKGLILGALKLAGGEDESEAQPAVLLKQAKAFVLRLAKRQRPEVTGSWRMCPST